MVKLRGLYRSTKQARILRVGVFFYSSLLAFHSLLFALGVFESDRAEYQTIAVYLLSFLSIVMALASILTSRRRPEIKMIQTYGTLIVSILLILTTTGISSPFSIGLTLILYDLYRTYRINGLVVGVIILFTASIFDAITSFTDLDYNPVTPILYVFTTASITLMIVLIIKTQLVRQSILEHSVKQADLERTKIKTLINNLNHGIVSINSEGIINSYNAAALNIVDTNRSLNGVNVRDALKVVDEDRHEMPLFDFDGSPKEGYSRDDVFIEYDSHGNDRAQLEVILSPISDGQSSASSKKSITKGYIIQLRDVTHQKSLDEEKDEFISVVSHELRTPIAVTEGVISNALAMYEKGIADKKNTVNSLKSAHNQVVFLAKMINDLSTLSRAERGVADDPEPINVREMIENFYREYEPAASDEGLSLNISVAPSVGYIFQSRLYVFELLQNFIVNALKYTNEGSITIKASQSKGIVTLAVKDTGIGISAPDRDNIYKKFFRSEDYRTRETRGTGLGLYVASKLARKLSTEINLKSRLNHGSEFSFQVPASDKPTTES